MNKSKQKQLIDTTQSKLVVARGEGVGGAKKGTKRSELPL